MIVLQNYKQLKIYWLKSCFVNQILINVVYHYFCNDILVNAAILQRNVFGFLPNGQDLPLWPEGYAWQLAAVMTLDVFQAVYCRFLPGKSKMADSRQIFCPYPSKILSPIFVSGSYTWCTLAYWEEQKRVGRLFPVQVGLFSSYIIPA